MLTVPASRGSYQTTVLSAGEKRLGEAAWLLARLWASAFAEAGSPKNLTRRFVKLEDIRVKDDYPAPDYLTERASTKTAEPKSMAVEPITPVSGAVEITPAGVLPVKH